MKKSPTKRTLAWSFLFPVALSLAWLSSAYAAPVWCEGSETLDSHPLNHVTLQNRVNDAGVDKDLAATIELIRNEFEKRQALVSPARLGSDSAYLAAFRNLFNTNNGPADFHFTFQEEFPRAFLPTTADDLDEFVFMNCDFSPAKQNAESNTQTNIALAAYAIDRIGGEIVTQNLTVVVASIDQISAGYRNWLLEQGLRQWPWELALNGWVNRGDSYNSDAPRNQWIFMRPSAGLEFQWASQDQASADASVGFEPFGIVRYLGDKSDYSRWWGISALVTLGTNDAGAGIGGLIRYKNYWLGVTDRKGQDDLYFFIGLDLHKFLKSDDGFKADIENRLEGLKKSSDSSNP